MSKEKATEAPIVENAVEVVERTKSKPNVAQQKKPKEDKMYLGPTIVGVVRHSTVFKNGVLPAKVEDCVKKFPAMQKLFVTMNELPAAFKELRKKQSALGAIYAQVVEKIE